MDSFPGTVKEAIVVVRTSSAGALHMIGTNPEPSSIVNVSLPAITISIPLPSTKAFHHVLIQDAMGFIGLKSFIIV
jgi:hypothetical protein